MATVILSLSSKANKISKKSEILIRIVGGRGHVFRCKSGLYINPESWSHKDKKTIIPCLATVEQKSLINL
jgi:hypothetical protein